MKGENEIVDYDCGERFDLSFAASNARVRSEIITDRDDGGRRRCDEWQRHEGRGGVGTIPMFFIYHC